MHHTYTLHVCYTCAACELLIHCRPLRWPSATPTRWADSRWMNRYMFELIRTYRRELSSAELHVSMIYLPIYLRRAMLRRSRSHGRRWAGKRSAGGLATRASAASLALTVRSARRRPSRWPTCSSDCESGQVWLRGKQGDEAAERHAPHCTLRGRLRARRRHRDYCQLE